jgi:hypothetical protein
MAIPLKTNARGGCATTDRPLLVVVPVSLLPGRTTNPYNWRDDVGAPDYVWDSAGADSEIRIKSYVRTRFRKLELQGRARLVSVSRTGSQAAPDGKVRFPVDWKDLETGDTHSSEVTT